MINVCYGIFDFVLFPNSLYFAVMIIFFFFLVIGLLSITSLNYLGITDINIDFLAEVENANRNGLTENELSKLEFGYYRSTRPPRDNQAALDSSNLSESEVDFTSNPLA